MQAILGIILSAILSENFILVKFYGICPFMGVSKKIDTALGMGMAVTFVMALASAATWAVNAALMGAWVSTALDVEVLRKPFGIYLLLSGASLVWPGKGQ